MAEIKKREEGSTGINPMCVGCSKYGRECEGTACMVWTGCVYRVRKDEVKK